MTASDVQSLVFSGYPQKPYSCLLLLRFHGRAARAWFRRIVLRVTHGRRGSDAAATALNVAVTPSGLSALGLDATSIAEFPVEFRDGMASPARSELLGDSGEDAPTRWRFGGPADRIDLVLLVYADSEQGLRTELSDLERGFARFSIEARRISTFLPEDRREHFGFHMSVEQPGLLRRDRRRGRARVPLGEFVLGHPNVFGERSEGPTAPFVRSTRLLPPLVRGRGRVDLGRNGTFLVVRQLEQRVDEFWRAARRIAERRGQNTGPERVGAEWVGRWPSGASLIGSGASLSGRSRDPSSPAAYRDVDPLGAQCPLGSHVRRANPRDALGQGARAHRLLRRGRLYALPSDGNQIGELGGAGEKGLLFLALNADLRRQFETVQGAFLNGRGGFGPPGEVDPLVGRAAGVGEPYRTFGYAEGGAARLVEDLPRFVRVRGGLYAFLPSLSALEYLAELGRFDGE